MKIRNLLIMLPFIIAFVFSGCSATIQSTNPSTNDAASSFNLIISNNKENETYHDQFKHFGLKLKDNDKFEWTEDASISNADFSISLNAEPFITAGLDVAQLKGASFTYLAAIDNAPGMLVHTFDVGNGNQVFTDREKAFRNLIGQIPLQLNALNQDGYILDIGQEFQVHWNGEQRQNKDIGFIINADDLIQAGLKIDQLAGWKVMKNKDVNDKQVRLIKIYYLK